MFHARRPSPLRRPVLALTVVLAMASGCGPQAPQPPAAQATRTAALLANQGSLSGVVLGPTAAIIGNNGSGVISQTKFYRTAALGDFTEAIADAQVVALDTTGKPLCASVKTDASGHYTLSGLAPSGPVIFVRASYTQDGHDLVLSRVVSAPRQGSATAQLDPASTLVAKKLSAVLTTGAFPADAIDPGAAAQLAEALAPTIDARVTVSAAEGSPAQAAQTFDSLLADDPATAQLASNVAVGQNLLASPTPSAAPSAAGAPSPTAAAPSTSPSGAPTAQPTAMPGPSGVPSPTPTPVPYVTTRAGNGTAGLVNGSAGAAAFNHPAAVARDSAENVYVADPFNHAIRKIAPDGSVTTLVSDPKFTPWGLAIGPFGVLFVTDTNEDVIQAVTPDGKMSVYAGAIGVAGAANGAVASARFNLPEGIVFDASGNMYVSDIGSQRIRRIDTSGTVSTLAGSSQGYADGAGTAAKFYCPRALCLDASGNLIVADRYNHRIRRVTPAGVVTTIAGNGTPGQADGPALQASFDEPQGVLLEGNGALLVSDSKNNCIRVLSPDGKVSTLLGASAGFADGGVGVGLFNNPLGLALDAFGLVLVADAGNNRVRVLAAPLK